MTIDELVQEARRLSHSWTSRFFQQDRIEELTRDLGERGGIRAICCLSSLVLRSASPVARPAAEALQVAFAHLSSMDYPRLEQQLRGEWYHPEPKLEPEDLAGAPGAKLGELSWVLHAIASCHHKGYVREAAVRRLDVCVHPEALGFLLLRANDWVEQVQAAALTAIRRRLGPQRADAIIHFRPLFTRLARASAADREALSAAADEVLLHPDSLSALVRGLSSRVVESRRSCFRLALLAPALSIDFVAERAFAQDDFVIRIEVLRTIIARKEASLSERWIPVALADPYPPVRREALSWAWGRGPKKSEAVFQAHLADGDITVRATCRRMLRQLDATRDNPYFAALYLEILAGPVEGRSAGAVAGLAEVGSSLDAPVMLRLLQHSSSRIRKAALRGLTRLGGKDHIETLLSALTDPSFGVSREAARAIEALGVPLESETLWTRFQAASAPQEKLGLLQLLATKTKWERVSYLLLALADPEPRVVARARELLSHWRARFNSDLPQPVGTQLAQAAHAFASVRHLMDETESYWMSFYIKD